MRNALSELLCVKEGYYRCWWGGLIGHRAIGVSWITSHEVPTCSTKPFELGTARTYIKNIHQELNY